MLHSDAMPEKMAKTLPKPLTPEGQEAAEAIGARRGDGDCAGEGVSQAVDQLARRRDTRVDGGVRRIDLHSNRQPLVSHRANTVTNRVNLAVYSSSS